VKDFAQRVDDDIMSLIPDLPKCRCIVVPGFEENRALVEARDRAAEDRFVPTGKIVTKKRKAKR
jgi:hypothetical protein